MKYKASVILLIIVVLLSFQSCTTSKNNISENKDYDSLKIADDGKIQKEFNYVSYSLKDFILLLKEKNITIVNIKGSDKAVISDGGSVQFNDTLWNYTFYPKMDSPYDVNSLNDLIIKQAIEAVYVKTPYETFVFRQSLEKAGTVVPIGSFYSDVIITANPSFMTEKEVKIGDSFEYASKKYNFSPEDIIKSSDAEWSVWVPDSNIKFIGTKDEITSIELGYQVACSS